MQPAFLSFILIAFHLSVPLDCTMRLQDPELLLKPQQSNFNTRAHVDASATVGCFYLELSGSVRKGIHRHLLAILPIRTDTSNFVSIFDLRRGRFLCMDSEGDLYNSRQKDRENCLFQHIWSDLANHQDVFYSMTGGHLLKLKGAGQRAHQKPPEPPSALVERLLGPFVKRQRRSEEVNPSDPLRSESHPPHSAMDHKDGKAGAVSKETISSSNDDPLRVLQSNGAVSPIKTNIADRAEQD